jgi:hypothetical protein
VFDHDGHVVEFENPIQGNTAMNGVYIAKVKKQAVNGAPQISQKTKGEQV